MSFNGNEGQFVTLAEASQWTANFRETSCFQGIHAQFYGKSKIQDILRQPGCVGIRVYRALDDLGVPIVVLVGTDANENDLYNGLILEKGTQCPPYCGGDGNPLQG